MFSVRLQLHTWSAGVLSMIVPVDSNFGSFNCFTGFYIIATALCIMFSFGLALWIVKREELENGEKVKKWKMKK